jgi:hypothetical protein
MPQDCLLVKQQLLHCLTQQLAIAMLQVEQPVDNKQVGRAAAARVAMCTAAARVAMCAAAARVAMCTAAARVAMCWGAVQCSCSCSCSACVGVHLA